MRPEIQDQFDAHHARRAAADRCSGVVAGNARAWEKFRAGSLLDRGPLSLRDARS